MHKVETLMLDVFFSLLFFKVAPAIKERMARQGTMLIGYIPNADNVNFFRIIFANSRMTKESVAFVLDEIDRLGRDLQV